LAAEEETKVSNGWTRPFLINSTFASENSLLSLKGEGRSRKEGCPRSC
jgi:hypothetical protein